MLLTGRFCVSTNGMSAWVTRLRNIHKVLLFALLQPNDTFKRLQEENNLTELMILQEALKTAPLGDVWEEYLSRQGLKNCYVDDKRYDKEVLSKR